MAWTRATAIMALTVCGCQAPRGPVEVKSVDPDLKIVAIQHDVCDKSVVDVPQMVIDLESDDAAVRFYSIQGLQRLTGDDFGYRYYEDDVARAPALSRWQSWLDRGGYTKLKRSE